MAYIILPPRTIRQPTGYTFKADRRVRWAFNAAAPAINLASGVRHQYTIPLAARPEGMAVGTPTSTGTPSLATAITLDSFSLVVALGTGWAGGGGTNHTVFRNASNSFFILDSGVAPWIRNNAYDAFRPGGTLWTQGTPMVMGVRNGAFGHACYVNGRSIASNTDTATFAGAGSFNDFGWFGTEYIGGYVGFLVYDSSLSNAELADVTSSFAAFWSRFGVTQRRIYVPSAGTGAQTLTQTKFTNTSIFGTHSLAKGAVALTQTKFTNTSTFGTHSLAQGGGTQSLTATKYTNTSAFGTHSLTATRNLTATKFTNTSTFGTQSVSVGGVSLVQTKFANTSLFGTHSLVQAGGPQILVPTKFTNTSVFGTQILTKGAVAITATKFTNNSTFGTQVITEGTVLSSTKFTNSSTFGTQSVSTGVVTLNVTKFTNTSTFGTHTIIGGETSGTVSGGTGGGIRLVAKGQDYTFMIKMVSDSDHTTGVPGLTLAISGSKAGGAFGTITPSSVVDRGSGWYAVTIDALDLDTEGDLVLIITAATADDQDVLSQVAISTSDAISQATSRLLTLGQFLALK